jgi:transketolase
MNITKDNLEDPDRDRFILSKGHCVEALYCVLEDKGILPSEMVDTYGSFRSPLGGHPLNTLPGIEFCSGALGHGLSLGVGCAIAAKMDGRPTRVFVVMGDGEQQEGSIYEAAMAGAQYKLGNLVAFIDRNNLQISGNTEDVMGLRDEKAKWTAFGWEVKEMNGDSIEDILRTVETIDYSSGRPHMIISHTTKGLGISYMENVAKWHHGVPTQEQYEEAMKELDARIEAVNV